MVDLSTGTTGRDDSKPFWAKVVTIIWRLWICRNDVLFHNHMSRPDVVCQEAIRDAASFLSAHEEGQLSSERVQLDRNSNVLGWQRPLEGWFKINFDGGVRCG